MCRVKRVGGEGDKMMWDAIERTDLGDKRLNDRLRQVVERLSATPGASIPQACGSAGATKAAYRFLG